MVNSPIVPKEEHWALAAVAVRELKAQQRPEELAMVLTMLSEREPKIMLEIGCADGGSLYCWTKVVPEVYGITLWSKENEVRDWYGANVLLSDSRKPRALDWITEKLDGRKLDVLFIDDDHSYEVPKYNYEHYSPLVRDGGLVLIHDVGTHRRFFPGLKQFWAELDKGYILSDTLVPELMVGFGVIEIGKD